MMQDSRTRPLKPSLENKEEGLQKDMQELLSRHKWPLKKKLYDSQITSEIS